ncbi:epimerase [Bacteroides uniformis]|nr:epimerase [Bacteroides uniformis]
MYLSIKNEQVHFIIHSVCTVFAPDKTKKVNETMLVNTYWWWHPLQLRQS